MQTNQLLMARQNGQKVKMTTLLMNLIKTTYIMSAAVKVVLTIANTPQGFLQPLLHKQVQQLYAIYTVIWSTDLQLINPLLVAVTCRNHVRRIKNYVYVAYFDCITAYKALLHNPSIISWHQLSASYFTNNMSGNLYTVQIHSTIDCNLEKTGKSCHSSCLSPLTILPNDE